MVGTAGAIIITVLVLAAVGGIGWVAYSRWRASQLGGEQLARSTADPLRDAAANRQLPPPAITSFIPFLHKSDRSGSNYGGPSPRPGGVQGWLSDQVRKFKDRNNRTAHGAYESAPYSAPTGGARRGFGPLDPDEAWDARVGNEADHYGPYEEQELGLHEPSSSSHHGNPYGGGSSAARNLGRGLDDEDTAYGRHNRGGDDGPDSYAMNLAATPGLRSTHEDAERGRSRSAVGRNPFDDDAAEPSNLSLRGVSPRPMDGEHGHGATADSPTERRSIFTEQV